MPKRYFKNPYYTHELLDKTLDNSFWKKKTLEFIEVIKANQPPLPKNADGGLYTGTPGLAYLFYYASKSPVFEDVKRELISRAVEYCITAGKCVYGQVKTCPTEHYGFVCCDGGVQAISAVVFSMAGKIEFSNRCLKALAAAAQYCDIKYSTSFGCNELFVGRAGYLLGLVWIKKTLQKTVISDDVVYTICKHIVDEGRQKSFPACPLWYTYYGTGYFGAAHGISSILFVLMFFQKFLDTYPGAKNDVKASVDYLLSLQTPNGNFPCSIDEIPYRTDDPDNELVHWCHGAPGIVYTMAKAYLLWKEPKYLQSCIKSAELVWQKGILKKGPGLCHGVAGNGYVFLLMYRLTNDIKYYHRALVFAEFMLTPKFRERSRRPDAPYSLYEGLAGAMCYLVDLLNPSEASFPFMDVFDFYD